MATALVETRTRVAAACEAAGPAALIAPSRRLLLTALIECSAVRPCTAKSDVPNDKRYNAAIDLFKAGRWAAAYGIFSTLADDDDPDAARIASFMTQYGPALFGSHWDAFPNDLAHWDWLASNKPLRKKPEFIPMKMPDAANSARSKKARNPSRVD